MNRQFLENTYVPGHSPLTVVHPSLPEENAYLLVQELQPGRRTSGLAHQREHFVLSSGLTNARCCLLKRSLYPRLVPWLLWLLSEKISTFPGSEDQHDGRSRAPKDEPDGEITLKQRPPSGQTRDSSPSCSVFLRGLLAYPDNYSLRGKLMAKFN